MQPVSLASSGNSDGAGCINQRRNFKTNQQPIVAHSPSQLHNNGEGCSKSACQDQYNAVRLPTCSTAGYGTRRCTSMCVLRCMSGSHHYSCCCPLLPSEVWLVLLPLAPFLPTSPLPPHRSQSPLLRSPTPLDSATVVIVTLTAGAIRERGGKRVHHKTPAAPE